MAFLSSLASGVSKYIFWVSMNLLFLSLFSFRVGFLLLRDLLLLLCGSSFGFLSLKLEDLLEFLEVEEWFLLFLLVVSFNFLLRSTRQKGKLFKIFFSLTSLVLLGSILINIFLLFFLISLSP